MIKLRGRGGASDDVACVGFMDGDDDNEEGWNISDETAASGGNNKTCVSRLEDRRKSCVFVFLSSLRKIHCL